MNTKTKFIILTIVLTVISILLTPILWPMPADGMAPTPVQLPFFIFMGIVESLSFGVGISFFVFNFNKVKDSDNLTKAAFVALTWSIASWWPHDNFHKSIGMYDLSKLLMIEYGFHITLIISGIILALYFAKTKILK